MSDGIVGLIYKMIPMVIERIWQLPIIGPLIRHRFSKFGVVGLSGMVVNLVVLYIAQEFLFKDILPGVLRLNLSLGLAIFIATINNFFWNRIWTWRDRKGKTRYGFLIQMGQYFVACGLAIGIQFGFTLLLAQFVYYLIANVISIVLAAVLNYLLNDIWTFSIRRSKRLRKKGLSLKGKS